MNHKFNLNDQEYIIKIWNGENLGQVVAVDTETTIVPFTMTPDLVTCQAYGGGENVYYVPKLKVENFMNVHEESIKVMHNAPFDNDVIHKLTVNRDQIYDMYDKCKIRDTGILYRLFHLAAYGWVDRKTNLKRLSEKYCGIILEKDERRENFSQFLNSELSDIPTDYLEYGALDAIATLNLYYVLLGKIQGYDKMGTLLSHDIQVKGDLALNHIYKNGIGFNLEARDEWLGYSDTQMEVCSDILASYGWVRGQKGVKDRFASIMKFFNIELPLTDKGMLSSTKEDLEPYKGNPFVDAYLKFGELEKASSFVRELSSNRVHPRYTTILNTGRTSCSKPNIQNIPRLGGLRELYIPEEGKVFVDLDYSALELAGLAQINLKEAGFSKMADLINEGKCLHYYTASQVYRKPEKDISKDERQFSKIPNFAFPTNMSPKTFIDYCKGYNVPMTLAQATELKDDYANAYPEIRDSFWKVPYGETRSMTLTGRLRSHCSYTALLNTKFQGLCADGAKIALYEVDKAGYKTVAFIHDQIMVEIQKDLALDALDKVGSIMVESMKQVIPDVKISVEGEIREKWGK